MAEFHQAPNALPRETGDTLSARGTRYGRVLFAIYLLFYGGYVGITAFAPAIMKRTPWAGINLSVLYGLGLIAAAFVMALIYDWLCRPAPDSPAIPPANLSPHGERR